MPSISTQNRLRSTAPSNSTATQTQTTSAPHTSSFPPTVTLRLRAEPVESRRLRWAEDVVDNEGLGRKKSKVCCIYHAPRAVGESSSEDDSSSDSDSSDSDGDSGGDKSKAMMGGKGKERAHTHGDGKDGCCDHEEGKEGKRMKGKRRKARNAYEMVSKRGGSSTVTEQAKT